MEDDRARIVTVFGGTGFLGRRIVQHLRRQRFVVRIASRRPAIEPGERGDPDRQLVQADVENADSIAHALSGASSAVNAVSLYVERGNKTYQSIHVEAAHRVAFQARERGVQRFVHVSGVGADAASPSLYIRKRGEGELAVRAAFPDAVILRPAVMFGPDDAFLTTILGLLHRLPVYPMFGSGLTQLAPAHVEDVAEAVARIMDGPLHQPLTVECGGPRSYRYKALLETVAREARLEVSLVPVPFALWHLLARLGEMLPSPPITRAQVELMEVDSLPSPQLPGLEALGIRPRAVEDVLREIIGTTGRAAC